MNYVWIGKNPIQKIKKTVKIAACEKKTTSKKTIFLFKQRFLALL